MEDTTQKDSGAAEKIPEFTLKAVILGMILSVIMAGANAYLGLYAGITVSASVPAAVISMAILRGILKRGTLLENNIVQTIASSGETLAAGIIFTVPALVIIGVWQTFNFWTTTLIAISGGLLGVVFMIPLRKALIVDEKELSYPEGIACAEVLQAGESGGSGFASIMKGLLMGGLVKIFISGVQVLKGTVEGASLLMGNRVFFYGMDISPALIGVGYIVKLEIAFLMFLGGLGAWLIGIPLLRIPTEMPLDNNAVDIAYAIWSTKIRYIGVGAMVVGGIWSIISVRTSVARGLRSIMKAQTGAGRDRGERTDRDMGLQAMGGFFALSVIIILVLYSFLTQNFGISVLTMVIMVIAGFFFVAVSSYIVGLIGSSNNPASGMTICTLLFTAALLLVFGFKGENAFLATLGVAGVVCCAAATAADISQDLKTGYLLGATPRNQQFGQVLGVLIAAFTIAPVLTLLHSAYGIGEGLRAPQATLFASITEALFGEGNIPWNMFFIGCIVALVLIVLNERLKKTDVKLRTHVMPVAVGIYLPLSLSVAILIGGIIRHFADRTKRGEIEEAHDKGILVASGMIAGESIAGILLAILIVSNLTLDIPLASWISNILSLLVILGVTRYLYVSSCKK